MTNPSDIPSLSSDQLKDKAEQILNQQPEQVQQAVKKTGGFVQENKNLIVATVVTVVALKVYKRKIAKTTAKQVLKALDKSSSFAPNGSSYPTMLEILDDLRNTPEMAYIDHTGKLLHLLRDRDIVVTLVGDFAGKTNEEVWRYAAMLLDGSKSLKLKAA